MKAEETSDIHHFSLVRRFENDRRLCFSGTHRGLRGDLAQKSSDIATLEALGTSSERLGAKQVLRVSLVFSDSGT